MIDKTYELQNQFKFQMKETIRAIFENIDKAIEDSLQDHPVTVDKSKFIAKYEEIKRRWINDIKKNNRKKN